MKILYIVPSLRQTGPVNVVRDLVEVMVNHGHECEVMYFDDVYGNEFMCPVTKIDWKTEIDFSKYDIVHSHCFRPDLFTRWRRRRFRGKTQFISTMHNFVFKEQKLNYNLFKAIANTALILYAARGHDKVITLTPSAKKYYSRWIPEENLRVCCNTRFAETKSPDPEDIKIVQDFKSSRNLKHLLGTNCGLSYRKGLDSIIKALPKLPEIGFIIVGDGPAADSLKQLSESEGVSDRMLFLGHRDDGARYLALYDLFVIPSRSEGFPLGLLEAAAIGKASVSSDIEVFKETFSEQEVPRFSIENQEQIIKAITSALSDTENLSKAILNRFEQSYSPEVFYNQHISVYKE